MRKKRANMLLEYILIFATVGIAVGVALAAFTPDVFQNIFKATFETNTTNNNSIEIGPITD